MSDVMVTTLRSKQIPAHSICKICQRAEVVGRGIACPLCRRVDTALGRLHDAESLTPAGAIAGANVKVLAERFGTLPQDLEVKTRDFHSQRLRAMSELLLLTTGYPGVVKWPGGPPWALMAFWDQWSAAYPAHWEVSVDCFAQFVRALHPWALNIEPRIHDGAWLRELVRAD